MGSGPGSYDIRKSVWHVNVSGSFNRFGSWLKLRKCCNPEINGGGGWGIFNALFGWTNSATYGSVISYNVYWLVVIAAFLVMRYIEKNGHWPLRKGKASRTDEVETSSDEDGSLKSAGPQKGDGITSDVHSVQP